MVVGELAFLVQAMLFHELQHLHGAFIAVDVRQLDIRFPERVLGGTLAVQEQAIGQHGRFRRRIDLAGNRDRPACAFARLGDRVRRQLAAIQHRQSHAIVAGVIDRFLDLDVQQVAALHRSNLAGLSAFGDVGGAARRGLLRIAQHVHLNPGVRRHENEVRRGWSCRQQHR